MLRPSLCILILSSCALASVEDLVPARWQWLEPKSLELVAETPINCLLVEWKTGSEAALTDFASAAAAKKISVMLVIRPDSDSSKLTASATKARLFGIVLEGDFPIGAAERVRDLTTGSKLLVIEMPSRNRIKLNDSHAIAATDQGVWPGVQATPGGSAKAGPSGGPWIDTNTGFLRAARAWSSPSVWIANRPPEQTLIPPEHYLQAIGDAALVGARWVVALDADLAAKLHQGDTHALETWRRMAQMLRFYEAHPEWRAYRAAAKLAVVQEPAHGALLSGGIIDMISAKRTPVRAVPPAKLGPESLAGVTVVVNADGDRASPAERDALKAFSKAGGSVLTAPPDWQEAAPADARFTTTDAELKKLDDMWHDVQSLLARKNLGVRLFNVSTMLFELTTAPDGKELLVNLVNYSDYPVENIAVQISSTYAHARLIGCDGQEKDAAIDKSENGIEVVIDRVGPCAALRVF